MVGAGLGLRMQAGALAVGREPRRAGAWGPTYPAGGRTEPSSAQRYAGRAGRGSGRNPGGRGQPWSAPPTGVVRADHGVGLPAAPEEPVASLGFLPARGALRPLDGPALLILEFAVTQILIEGVAQQRAGTDRASVLSDGSGWVIVVTAPDEMRQQMNNQLVEVFLGDPVDNRGELQVLNRLRTDLERLRVPARIFANFMAGHRQVDLLVVTEHRMAHVEVKGVDQRFPVVGRLNGQWHKQLPDGRTDPLGRNYFRQAHETTYAISDAMRQLAKTGAVPAATKGDFFRDIDTVLCFTPGIPSGSTFEPHKYVSLIDYDALMERLTTPGPRPAWPAAAFDAFARHLGVYLEPPSSPAAGDRQRTLEALTDYRDRYVDVHRVGLHELVSTPGTVEGNPDDVPVARVVSASRALGIVTVVGASGMGKTHLAKHASLELACGGAFPIWVRCRDYVAGRFNVALSRAVATATTVPVTELISAAKVVGVPVVAILDGFNECPVETRTELLEQLNAFRLWSSAGAIITSREPVPVADAADVTRVALRAPEAEQRDALLASYGASGLAGSEAFTTALELSLAAQCASDLPADASRTDVFDAYVRRVCPKEVTRAALRRLAARLDDGLRLGLPTTEALAAVRGVDPERPQLIDDVLASPLLSVAQGRVAFTHESFGTFLTAEQRVHEHSGADALATSLRRSRSRDLTAFGVGLQPDGDDRAELLVALAEAESLADAARGCAGPATTLLVRRRIVTALGEAQEHAENARFELNDQFPEAGTWTHAEARTEQAHALLEAAALCLPDGLFIPEVAVLMDATDAVCAREMRRVREAGNTAAISTVISATYSGILYGGGAAARELAASVIVRTCEMSTVTRRWRREPYETTATGLQMLTSTDVAPRWGRLFLALLLLNSRAEADLRTLPDLLSDAWKMQGYHLRLQALRTAGSMAPAVEGEERARVLDALRSLDVNDNIFLSSALVEALSAYDDIQPIATVADIVESIATILAADGDPHAYEAAAHILASQFENESIVGPYSEAIENLPAKSQAQLHAMALKAEHLPFEGGTIARRLADLSDPADEGAIEVLHRLVQSIDMDNPMRSESVEAHDAALAWFARHDLDLPSQIATDVDLTRHAWQCLDQLTLAVMRQKPLPGEQAERQWNDLLDLCPLETAVVMYCLQLGTRMHFDDSEVPFCVLVKAFPEQVRRLQEWVLGRLDASIISARVRAEDLRGLAIDLLGRVGTAETAAVLRPLADGPDGGRVVTAVHAIERRLSDVPGDRPSN